MPSRLPAQRNEFRGNISNERGLFMAGAQINTAGGNVTIIGGGGEESRNVAFSDAVGSSGGVSQRIREREGLCILSLGESASSQFRRIRVGWCTLMFAWRMDHRDVFEFLCR
jgi:hypothetical protein